MPMLNKFTQMIRVQVAVLNCVIKLKKADLDLGKLKMFLYQ